MPDDEKDAYVIAVRERMYHSHMADMTGILHEETVKYVDNRLSKTRMRKIMAIYQELWTGLFEW